MELFGREVEAAQARRLLLERLEKEGDDERAARLRKCGLTFPLFCKGCGHRHEASQKCNRKWCPSCAPKRANERAARLRAGIRLMRWPMHITLTVPNIAEGDVDRNFLRHLLVSFRKLRKMKLWAQNVTGGVYGMEVTNKGAGWHPHIHIVADCRWLALKTPEPYRDDDAEQREAKFRCAAQELQSAWAAATQMEMHKSIWVRRCDADAAAEIVKYAIKGEHLLNCSGSARRMCEILDSCRLTSPFGSMRGLALDEHDDYKLTCPNGHSEWTPVPPHTPTSVIVNGRKISLERQAEIDAAIDREVELEKTRTI